MNKEQKKHRIYLPAKALFCIVVVLCLCAILGNIWLKKNYEEAFVAENESEDYEESALLLTEDGNYNYEIKADDTVKIVSYCGKEQKNLVIPEMIEGRIVTEIGEGSFTYHEELESIQFPETVTTVRLAMFSSSINLREVYFGKNVTEIEEYAFSGFDGVLYAPEDSALYEYAKKEGIPVEILAN